MVLALSCGQTSSESTVGSPVGLPTPTNSPTIFPENRPTEFPSQGKLESPTSDGPASPTSISAPTDRPVTTPLGNALVEPTEVLPESGVIEVRVTDAPLRHLTTAFATFVDLQIQSADTSGWTTIDEGPITLDIVSTIGIEETIASSESTPGVYSALRLKLAKMEIEADEVIAGRHPAKITEPQLLFEQEFTLGKGQTTILVLDFDLQSSFYLAGRLAVYAPEVDLAIRTE